MKLLALDTATDILALAVCDGARSWQRDLPGAGNASSHLIPQALSLLNEAGLNLDQLDAIAFGMGPGAFTGLRTAVSVAQGLAFGLNKPVLAIDSLLVLVEDAWAQAEGATNTENAAGAADECSPVWWAAQDARMDEVYAGAYQRQGHGWLTLRAPALYDLATLGTLWQQSAPQHIAGNATGAFAGRLPVVGAEVWPQVHSRSAALLRLARQAWLAQRTLPPEEALPVYLRDKVALTTAEREAAKAATLMKAG